MLVGHRVGRRHALRGPLDGAHVRVLRVPHGAQRRGEGVEARHDVLVLEVLRRAHLLRVGAELAERVRGLELDLILRVAQEADERGDGADVAERPDGGERGSASGLA